jgi:hypothetical protein
MEYVFSDNVVVTPSILIAGVKATVEYKGLLPKSGADKVFMHLGFGDKWNGPRDIEMKKTEDGFKAEFDVESNGTMNITFKDSANNWDNNSGKNYTYRVH